MVPLLILPLVPLAERILAATVNCSVGGRKRNETTSPQQQIGPRVLIHITIEIQLSHVTRKPAFGVCDQLRLEPACSAIDTS